MSYIAIFAQLQNNCIIAPLQSNPDYRAIGYVYETVCLSGAECTAALEAFHANVSCFLAISNDQTEISCGSRCLNASNDVFSACPNVSSGSYVATYIDACMNR